MKNKNLGYTLIELVMAVSLLVIVLVGGTAIFYRSFRSSGISDIQTALNNSLRSLDEMIERSLRYGKVSFIGASNRDACLTAGATGISGNSMTVIDPAGESIVYTLTEGVVSSASGTPVPISNPEIEVTKLEFTWYCRSGVNDKIKMVIEAKSKGKSEEIVSGDFVKDINLLNSGIN